MSNASVPIQRRPFRRFGGALIALAVVYLLLLIPEASPPQLQGAGKQAFLWNRDAFWAELETRFREAQTWDSGQRTARFNELHAQVHRALEPVAETNLPPDAPAFAALEQKFFEFAPIAAASPERLPDFLSAAARLRQLVKWQSERWPTNSPPTRQRLYRLLYGSRAAVEEALLQVPGATNALILQPGAAVAATPGAEVLGVKLHSGDILLSRGGAATSALIARGNDYPGNFSHVALAHVDEVTKQVSVIEAHIESGVGVSPIEHYLRDTKLRILVLRLRGNLPSMIADPLLPHNAASLALRNALARHIPYDFAMDDTKPEKQFCSEVAGAAYQSVGVTLWANRSHLSTPGVVSWLGTLGVRQFETQEPSDLEYDPQLSVVAEWRDPDTLFRDHVDNAVIDAMLETAERGARLDYHHWKLPFIRLAKAWSVLLNQFGQVGPVPEGMSATTALRVQQLTAKHAAVKTRVLNAVAEFKAANGYVPPYWELLRLARQATAE
jgi:hypothetical protein